MEDRCPGVLRLHAAADGHLLRIRVPGGHITADALAAIADLAETGNGLIELTSRASVQVRGLTKGDADFAAARLTAAGLLPSPGHDRVRNILAAPLGGRDDRALLLTDELVTALDRDLCRDTALARLPGRFLFAVEDGSRTLGGGQGDVTLAVEPTGEAAGVRLRLHLAGRPTTRSATQDEAAGLALDAARAFLTVLETTPPGAGAPVWRIADLPAADLDRLLATLETSLAAEPVLAGGRPIPPGVVRQADGDHAITALAPLGRLDAGAVRGLAALAVASGGRVRLSPWRTVSLVDVPAAHREPVLEGLRDLRLVLDATSGWQGLSACAGLGACAKARIDVHAAAALRAAVREPAEITTSEHWSACERRCGRPPLVDRAATATATGIEVHDDGVLQRVASVEEALALLGDGTRAKAPEPTLAAAGGARTR